MMFLFKYFIKNRNELIKTLIYLEAFWGTKVTNLIIPEAAAKAVFGCQHNH